MITAISKPDGPDGPMLTLNVSSRVSGGVVYLDNWAICDLAEENPQRRARFLNTIRSGFDLLFSVANVVEIGGPQGRSAEAIRAFLNEIGPHWIPVELDTTAVSKRELDGEPNACVSGSFLKYYTAHLHRASPQINATSDEFFRLGGVLDWVEPERDSLRQDSASADEVLIRRIRECSGRHKDDKTWLDTAFPPRSFHPLLRACFVHTHLVRALVLKGITLKKNDGMDFCHAVMASAYSSFAALDSPWKQRVLGLPRPNGLARIYSKHELDGMVTDMESWLESQPPETAHNRIANPT